MRGHSLLDTPLITVTVVVISVIIFIGYIILSSFSGTLLDGLAIQSGLVGFSFFHYLPMAVTVGFLIAAFISAFYLKSHPIFFPIFSIITAILVFFNVAMADVLLAFADASEMAATVEVFPLIIGMFQNWPFIMIVVAFVIILGMYAFKNREGGGQGV